MKICRTCKIIKNNKLFSISELKRNTSQCKVCRQNYSRNYNIKNKNIINSKQKIYYENNRNKILNNKKEYHIHNKRKRCIYNQNYYTLNKDLIRDKNTKYIKNRRRLDPIFRIRNSCSRAINLALKNKNCSKFGKSILKYLPYTIKELKEHIEKQFEPWMIWNNWGVYNLKTWDDNNSSTWTWQIDHIIPHSTFKYISMEDDEFKKCWSLENLRPLSSKVNNIKNKY